MQHSPRSTGGPAEPATAAEAMLATLMVLGRRMRQRLPEDPIDYAALPVLRTLSRTGPMRVSALAAALELDASTVSRQVRHLEERGLLERTEDPDDGRASQVALSAEGGRCWERAAKARLDLIEATLRDWSPAEREQLRGLLDRFTRDLAPDEPQPRTEAKPQSKPNAKPSKTPQTQKTQKTQQTPKTQTQENQ